MTWDELKQKALEMGGYIFYDEIEYIVLGYMSFYADRTIMYRGYGYPIAIATERSPDQMWQIMEALK